MAGFLHPSDGDFSTGPGTRYGKKWVAHAGHSALGEPHASSVTTRRRSRLRGRSTAMVELDGARGEGGGQILRSALTLAMITGRAFSMKRIRANRDKPGLRPQHLAALQAAAAICSAEVTGAEVGSRTLTFRPREIEARDFQFDIGTAGSTALVLQTIHLPLAMKAESPVRVVLEGGTFNTSAPSYPFLQTDWRRHMASIGLSVGLAMPNAGFYPAGGGRIEAWIEPGKPQALVADRRGALRRICAEAGVCKLPNSIAERMLESVAGEFAERGLSFESGVVEWHGRSPGTAISLTLEHENAYATFVGLGERGKRAEAVAGEALLELLAHLDVEEAAIDPYSADQLLLPLALAEGKSIYTTSEITEHLRTNVATVQQFLDRPIEFDDATESRPARIIVG